MSDDDEITVYFTDIAYRRMMALARKATGEVSGWGRILVDDDGDIVCDQVVMLDQHGSSGGTHINMIALGTFMVDLAKKHGPKEVERWRLWWHSHPGWGSPSYSNVDFASLEDRAKTSGCEFFVGVVVDGGGRDGTSYVHVMKPFKHILKGGIHRLRDPLESLSNSYLSCKKLALAAEEKQHEDYLKELMKVVDEEAKAWAKAEHDAHMKPTPVKGGQKADPKAPGRTKKSSRGGRRKKQKVLCRCGRALSENDYDVMACSRCQMTSDFCCCPSTSRADIVPIIRRDTEVTAETPVLDPTIHAVSDHPEQEQQRCMTCGNSLVYWRRVLVRVFKDAMDESGVLSRATWQAMCLKCTRPEAACMCLGTPLNGNLRAEAGLVVRDVGD